MIFMSNVVQISNMQESINVYGSIITYLNRVGQDSENTAITYEKAIRDFFLTTRNKDIEYLNESDLNYSMQDVEAYQTELRKTCKASTVNTKMSAIKKLMDKLDGYGLKVNSKVFDVERYKEYDTVSYDPMSKEEVLKFMDIVSKTRKGEEKALFINVAFVTAFRKESILNLKWSDIEYFKGVWTIKTLGKGNVWDRKKIPQSLFLGLTEYREKIPKRDRIFTLSNTTINGMMKLVRDEIDFGERTIAFHSLKKSSIEETAILTNYDLKAMQAQGNHANVATTLNNYMSAKKFDDMITLDLSEEFDFSILEGLSKEELIGIIKKADRVTQIKLINTAKENV